MKRLMSRITARVGFSSILWGEPGLVDGVGERTISVQRGFLGVTHMNGLAISRKLRNERLDRLMLRVRVYLKRGLGATSESPAAAVEEESCKQTEKNTAKPCADCRTDEYRLRKTLRGRLEVIITGISSGTQC